MMDDRRHVSVLAFLAMFLPCLAGAQTTREWLAPKKTQIEYLTRQVLFLKLQTEAIREGSGVLEFGLNLVGWNGESEGSSHADHFGSHTEMGPLAIQERDKILAATWEPGRLEGEILKSAAYWDGVSAERYPRLWNWSQSVHRGLYGRCRELSGFYRQLLTEGMLEMEDAKRAEALVAVASGLRQVAYSLARLGEVSKSYVEMYGYIKTQTK